MMTHHLKIVVGLAFMVPLIQLSASAQAERAMPFGLQMGMTKAQLGLVESARPVAPGMYKLTTVPKPHPEFESYLVQVAPTTGLCFVKAIGKDISTNVYGSDLKRKYEDMRDQLGAI